MKSPFYSAEHEAYRDVVRRFVEREIEPYAHQWDEAGEFPRTLYAKAAEIGLLGLGFPENFYSERMGMAASCTAYARVCLDEAIAYAKERKTFGKPIAQHQVIRHKLVDMAQRVAASQAMLEMLAWRLEQGESPVAEICMMKNQATQTMAFCASEAVQIFGGAGFMRGVKVERIYREVKVNAIGGGTEEIMKDLASRQMGL